MFISSIIACLITVATALTTLPDFAVDNHMRAFKKWQKRYGKSYEVEEEAQRFAVFVQNWQKIVEHNANAEGYELDLNEFADMTAKQFRLHIHGHLGSCLLPRPFLLGDEQRMEAAVPNANVPASVDWRSKNMVTPVKNQGQCGSCWAFSATGALESRSAIKTGNLIALSEQQLVDCSGAQGNQGCQGGLMDQAFEYVKKNGGLCSEADYPYKGSNQQCTANCTAVDPLTGFTDVTHNSESDLRAAVAKGPVSIAIQANQMAFQFYRQGVLKGKCGTSLDHGVLVVGYGTDNGTDYWLVKNSWGERWGESGYLRICRNCNKNEGAGECGILMQPSFPSV